MLLERIDIDSCGSLERIQLGPFSHRLNTVYGPRGAGKTATLEFIRGVMLGTDRDWHRGATGSVVWADREGLLHCRREGDGTAAGRLSIDYVARNDRMHDHHYGYRDPRNYDRLHRMTDLPRETIDALVAATRQTPLASILEACRSAGLETYSTIHDAAAIARIRELISALDRQLEGYRKIDATRPELEATRRRLLDELDEIERLERLPCRNDRRTEELVSLLAEASDEVARLSHQEAELRHLISEIRRDLAETGELPRLENPRCQIAVAHRRELEELDNQLMRWRRTLRELCSIRAALSEPISPRRDGGENGAPHRPLQARLQSLGRQIDFLVQRWTPSTSEFLGSEMHRSELRRPELAGGEFAGTSAPGMETLAASLQGMRDELSKTGHRLCDRYGVSSYHAQRQQLRLCQEMLVRFIDRLIDTRNLLLRRIASEYDLPLEQLVDAFGDWRQCHDHPHLYQWLLSDKCPPRIDDAEVHASRRKRLEQEQSDLLEQLGRTVNRLDDQAREARLLQLRLRELPNTPATPLDTDRREACRSELLRVEERLRWLDARTVLDEERQRHQRHLDDLLRGSARPSVLLTAAAEWLSRLSPQRALRLSVTADGSLRVEGGSPDRLDDAERQTVAMAIRMAAAEELGRRGHQVPLLVDDPAVRLSGAPSRLAATLGRFTDGGRQMVVFTENRALADAIRNMGGRLESLAAPQYIQMRYRGESPNLPARDSLSSVNRDLDMMWREANGLYDDPYWYQRPRRRATSQHEYAAPYQAAPYESASERPLASETAPRAKAAAGQPFVPGDHERSDRVPSDTASPFFLSGDSPVDQAPSIDAVAAERLTQIGIARVGQLLAADPQSVAERLGLADVTPAVVRRWQGEARLVCTVPQLRNFDARVLVGCGLNDPKQLAQMHPGQLLENVEGFLATDQGRRILQSGTSYELSRITSWIAAANRSVARSLRHGERSLDQSASPSDAGRGKSAARQRRASRNPQARPQNAQEHSSGRGRRGPQPPPSATAARRDVVSLQIAPAGEAPKPAAALRFYLHRRDPVADAPSIGPKAADRLSRIGIRTVDDLLFADPAEVAEKLRNRRVDQNLVRRWQQQAALVCRVPMLRGQDAELLVAVDVTDPEQLAAYDPTRLLRQIDRLAASAAGRRILRGAAQPDSEEISRWIGWAQHRRNLRAA